MPKEFAELLKKLDYVPGQDDLALWGTYWTEAPIQLALWLLPWR